VLAGGTFCVGREYFGLANKRKTDTQDRAIFLFFLVVSATIWQSALARTKIPRSRRDYGEYSGQGL